MLDFFLAAWAPGKRSGCSLEARIISVHLTASCSSIRRSLYWLRSISTRAISTRVNLFLCAIGTSSCWQKISNALHNFIFVSEVRQSPGHTYWMQQISHLVWRPSILWLSHKKWLMVRKTFTGMLCYQTLIWQKKKACVTGDVDSK